MIIKVAFNKQIHLYKGQADFSNLKFHCANVFKMLPKYFQFYYFDSEHDKITVSSQHDLETVCEGGERQIKFFIQETDGEFQLLFSDEEDYQQIVEEKKLKQYDAGIKTRNIVSEKMSQDENMMVQRISHQFILSLEAELVKKSLQEEEDMIKDEVSKLISNQLQAKVLKNIIEEEEKTQIEEVNRFLSKISQNCSKKFSKSDSFQMIINSKYEAPIFNHQISMATTQQQISLNKLSKNEILIEKMVDEKIKKLIPELTKKIVLAVEAKLKINGHIKEPIKYFKKTSQRGFYQC